MDLEKIFLKHLKTLKVKSYLKDFTFKNVMAIQTIGDVIRNLELGAK